jgi:hypothetical protein
VSLIGLLVIGNVEYCVPFRKLIEVVCNLPSHAVVTQLRNPSGDRIRKLRNCAIVLGIAGKHGIDVSGGK